jgi:hypothetical protein
MFSLRIQPLYPKDKVLLAINRTLVGVGAIPGGSGGKKESLPLMEFDLRKIGSFIWRKLIRLKVI